MWLLRACASHGRLWYFLRPQGPWLSGHAIRRLRNFFSSKPRLCFFNNTAAHTFLFSFLRLLPLLSPPCLPCSLFSDHISGHAVF